MRNATLSSLKHLFYSPQSLNQKWHVLNSSYYSENNLSLTSALSRNESKHAVLAVTSLNETEVTVFRKHVKEVKYNDIFDNIQTQFTI